MSEKKLTPKQERFVQEYLIDLNATQAAIRAGYSKKTANPQGARLLANVSVQAAISEAQKRLSSRIEISQERVALEFARIAFHDMRKLMKWGGEKNEFIPSEDLDDDTAAAISEVSAETRRTFDKDGDPIETVKLRVKACDKVTALTQLGRHLGMFKDKSVHEHTGPDGSPLFTLEQIIRARREASSDD